MTNFTKKCLSALLAVAVMFTFTVASFASYADDAGIFRISCTVNGDSKTQRGFCWYTVNDSETKISIYKNGSDVTDELTLSGAVSEKWQGCYMHKITVSGLEAGTDYTYKIGDGADLSREGSFTTDDGDDEVNAVVFADIQASSIENFNVGARAVTTAYRMVGDKLDFAVNLGDFTNDSTDEEWNYYAEAFDKINLTSTLVPVAGNHDGLGKYHWFNNMFNLDTSKSVQNLNGVNYSFDYGNAHFAVLNTNDMLTVSYSQLKWLEKDMNSSSSDWKIVLMHKTPYSLGKDGKWPDAMYLQEALSDVCDKCGVDLVLSGHDHQYLRTKPLTNNEVRDNGSVYVLCGTAGSKRYEIRKFAVDNFTQKSFINTMVAQKDGFYFNGTDFDSQSDEYIGSCFNTLRIKGGELEFKSYIISDDKDEVTLIDDFTLSKQTGEGEATYDGDTSTGTLEYAAGGVGTVFGLLTFVITKWLPRVIKALPEIIGSYISEGVF
ncbi:MAG: metallophosphoesterase [Acutalibacteraceae bacterium]|nr:metallophosphoesterase family protein [Oscillospiraceae bacterium]